MPNSAFEHANPDPASSDAPYRIYNIGNHNPVELMKFIEIVEKAVGRKAVINLLPMQPGDVEATYADTEELRQNVGFQPDTPLDEGISRFVAWFKSYYCIGRGGSRSLCV